MSLKYEPASPQVTKHLDGAFKDERGRDRKPKEAKRSTVDEVATAKVRASLLLYYSQA